MIDLESYLFRVHQAQGLTQSKVGTPVTEIGVRPYTSSYQRVSVHLWGHRHMHGSTSPGGRKSGSGIRTDKKLPPKEKERAKMAEEETHMPSLAQQALRVLKERSGARPQPCLPSWKRRSWVGTPEETQNPVCPASPKVRNYQQGQELCQSNKESLQHGVWVENGADRNKHPACPEQQV